MRGNHWRMQTYVENKAVRAQRQVGSSPMEQVRVQHLREVILPTWDQTKLCFQTRRAAVDLFFKDSWAEAKTWTPLKLELSDFSMLGSLINICVFVCVSVRISTMSRGCFRRVSGPRASRLRPWPSTLEAGSTSLWLRLQPHSPWTTRWVLSRHTYTLITFNLHCTYKMFQQDGWSFESLSDYMPEATLQLHNMSRVEDNHWY